MSGFNIQPVSRAVRYAKPEAGLLYACISTAFRTFCKKLYYFSNFKDFNTLTLNR